MSIQRTENAPTEKEHLYVQCKTQQEINRRIEEYTTTNLKWKTNIAVSPVHCNKSEWLDGRLLPDSN